jgi:MFS transporter, NNP family, nitrate/nitrite transporter
MSDTTPAPFSVPVDENNRARQLRILSLARPHARAFNFAWVAFFLAFFGWFAISPLLKRIRDSPDIPWLDNSNIKDSNIVAVAGTIIMRLAVGPFCDRFGPRWAMSGLITLFSLPVFCLGLSRSFAVFTTLRFFIGFIGATFVVTQFWTTMMYARDIVGTANATAAGWGNLGGGATNAIMPLVVNGLERKYSFDNAWRIAQVIPASLLLVTGIALFFLCDDCPDGQYRDLIKAGTKTKTNPFVTITRAAKNYRVWILFATYGACFGIELVMNGNLATYIGDEFGVDSSKAGLIAGLFGLMNLFARSLGGILSDLMSKKWGMRGRLWALFFVLLSDGLALIAFSRITTHLSVAIPVLVIFSIFVQMSEGATFGIVPFVDPEATGAVSGIVGAGGNVGAVIGGYLLKPRGTRLGFLYLGFCVIAITAAISLLHFPAHGSLFFSATNPKMSSELVDDIEEEVISE